MTLLLPLPLTWMRAKLITSLVVVVVAMHQTDTRRRTQARRTCGRYIREEPNL
jgi:hypothetical protein